LDWSKKYRRDGGAVALEMALVTPILLLLILGISTIGHAMVVRFMLSSAAYDAARSCTLERTPTVKCARELIHKKMGATKKWCISGPSVKAVVAKQPGFITVNAFEVKVECNYGGHIGKAYLAKSSLIIATLHARASMPY